MMGLEFWIAGQRYALPCRDVLEVVPLPELRTLPGAPPHVGGVFVHRGAHTPVIDLVALVTGVPARRLFSTRVMLVEVRGRRIGLAAERITDTIAIDEASLEAPSVHVEGAPWLGRMFHRGATVTQLVEPNALVAGDLEALLFGRDGGAA
jgi:chemotaxis-related protein WspB